MPNRQWGSVTCRFGIFTANVLLLLPLRVPLETKRPLAVFLLQALSSLGDISDAAVQMTSRARGRGYHGERR